MSQRRTIAERVNAYLAEPDGAQFRDGKWRFWFLAVAFLSVVNSALTWLIFRDDAENYSGPVMLSVGALVAWLCVGALHYSDSSNRQLARSVSVVDSIALLFVVIHFSGLLYVYGHHRTLRSAEARFEQQATKFNEDAQRIQDANVKIADAAQAIARETTKAEKLRNDTAYQNRKAAEAGARGVPRSASAAIAAPGLQTSQIELERPTRPAESSAAFLTKWDWLIRLANCGELLLACLTLILIRNVSARSNSPTTQRDFYPPQNVASRSPIPAPTFRRHGATHVSSETADDKETTQDDTAALKDGLRVLRETLRLIAFHTPGTHYKADLKPDCVWIRAMISNSGIQRTGHAAKAKHSILRSALRMEPERFRAQVELWLQEHGFFEDTEEN